MDNIQQYLDITILDHLQDKIAQHAQTVKPNEEILYAFLTDPDSRDYITDAVKVDWFTNASCGYCMEVLIRAHKSKHPIDDHLIHQQLITELSNIDFQGIVPEFYRGAIKTLKRMSHEELLKANHIKAQEIYSNKHLTVEQKTSEISRMFTVTNDYMAKATKKGRVSKIKDSFKYIQDCQTGNVEFCNWGLSGLDAYMKLRKHACYFVGALPGTGKTAFAVSCIVNQCKAGKRVFFWCGEMTEEQIHLRFISQLAELTLDKLETEGSLTEGEWQRVLDATNEMANWDLHTLCGEDMSFPEIASEARALHKSKPLDAVWCDYYSDILPRIELLSAVRHEQMADISKDIKSLKKELPVPLIILAQLKREAVDRYPKKTDLAESSSCERAADGILLLDRPIKGKDVNERNYWINDIKTELANIYGRCAIVIGKNRHGPECTSLYEFQGNFMQFGDEVKFEKPEKPVNEVEVWIKHEKESKDGNQAE